MTKNITLPNGRILEVEVTTFFLEIVRKHFKLEHTRLVNDTHIRLFIHEAFKNAIDKAENEDVHASS